MLAGATEIEITPPIGGMIMGPEAISTGVHDPLMAKALYVDDGQSPWFILSIDLMALDFALSDRIRQEITARTGAKAVILNFTHTHAAPYSAPWSVPEFEKHCELEKDWRESLVTKIPDLAVAAKAQAESVSLKVGRAPVAIGVHRRVWNGELMTMAPNFHGPIIPWVDVLEARTADGKLIGVVFSHAAHPVVVHMTSTEMGADFPGYAAAALRDEYGEGIFLFCQACSANINSYPLATGEKNAEHAGRKLAAATILAMSTLQELTESFTIMDDSIDLACEDMPSVEALDELIAMYEKRQEAEKVSGPVHRIPWWVQDKLDGIRSLREDALAGKQRAGRMDLSLIKAGDQWAMMTLSNEPFSEYQLQLDRDAPFASTMVLGYCQGVETYVPTDEALSLKEKGGYEAASFPVPGAASFRYPLRLTLKEGIEGQILDAVKRMWETD